MATNITADVSLNISKLMSEKKISSEAEFARLLGVSKYVVSKWKTRNTYNVDKILEVFPDVDNIWLLTGEGSMLKSSAVTSNEEATEEVASKSKADRKRPPIVNEVEILGRRKGVYIKVPFLDMGVQAGWHDNLRDWEPRDEDEVEFRYVSPEHRFGRHYVVRVSGDSMDDGTKNSISDGDEVLVRLVDDFDWNGLAISRNLYVIVTREGTVLKQILEVNKEEGYILCHSYNKDFCDYRIELEDIRWFFSVSSIVNRRVSL